MKITKLLLITIIFGMTISTNAQKTTVKGKVHKWISDTVYVTHLTFYSPYSSRVEYKTISKDSTFQFEWNDLREPFIIAISPLESFAKNLSESLLYENLTQKYYFGQCIKFFKNGSTIYFIEPNTTLDIDLTANTWFDVLSNEKAEYFKKLGATIEEGNRIRDYGQTAIKFNGESNNFSNRYFQQSIVSRTRLDNVFDRYSSQTIPLALINLKKTKEGLLNDLELNKEKLNQPFYRYLKTEIEFGAKMEFLKFLQFKHKDYLKEIIAEVNVPEQLLEILAFDRYGISDIDLKSEMYNEYLEFYLNFMMNYVNKEFMDYHLFDLKKIQTVIEDFPEKSAYFYISNHILNQDKKTDYNEVIKWLITKYPNGELNKKLKMHLP